VEIIRINIYTEGNVRGGKGRGSKGKGGGVFMGTRGCERSKFLSIGVEGGMGGGWNKNI